MQMVCLRLKGIHVVNKEGCILLIFNFFDYLHDVKLQWCRLNPCANKIALKTCKKDTTTDSENRGQTHDDPSK